MIARKLWFLGLWVVVIGGCSDDRADVEARLQRVEGFCDNWAELACNDRVVDQCAATDVEACRNAQSAFCRSLIPDGKYSNDHALECLEAVQLAYEDAELSAEERDTVRSLSGHCNRVVSGSGSEGDACLDNGDCSTEAGLSCVRKAGQTEGSCEEAEEVGGGFKCSGSRQICSDGFYCDGQNCIEKNGDGDPCSEDIPCADAFKCEAPEPELGTVADAGPASDDRTCVPRLAVGSDEPCKKNEDCLSDVCAVGLNRAVCAAAIILSPTEPVCDDLS